MTRQTTAISAFGPISVNETGAKNAALIGVSIDEGATPVYVPPPNPPNSGNGKKGAPGQNKKQEMILAGIEHRRHRRKRHDFETDATAFIPAQYLSPAGSSHVRGIDAIERRLIIRRITLSASGRTIRKH